MSARFILPNADVGSGISPSRGAKLFFFDSGTSTESDTFITEDLDPTKKNENPVEADAKGVFPDIWLPSGKAFKVRLEDRNGVQTGFGEADPVFGGVDPSTTPITLSTETDMETNTGLVEGNIVQTLGYLSEGDGGNNVYLIVAEGTGTADGGSFIDLTSPSTDVQAQGLFPFDIFRFEQFGADQLAANNAVVMQACIDFVDSLGTNGEITFLGNYTITTPLEMKAGVSIVGQGGESSKIIANDCNGLQFNFTTTFGNTILRNFYLQGVQNVTQRVGIVNQFSTLDTDELFGAIIDDLLITDFSTCILTRHFQNFSINNCWLQDCTDGIVLQGKVFNGVISNNYIVRGVDATFDFFGQGIQLASFVFDAGTEVSTGIRVENNFISGFDNGVFILRASYPVVNGNDIEATFRGIEILTIDVGDANIKDNFVAMTGGGTLEATSGILASNLGAADPGMVNIEGNSISSTATVAGFDSIEGGNNRNVNILRNLMDGAFSSDIQLSATISKANIENNRCLSTVATGSINVSGVNVGPVYIDKNHCVDTIETLAADVTASRVIIGHNIINTTTNIFGTEDIPSTASVAALTLPIGSLIHDITGTNSITSITNPTAFQGRTVTLKFNAALTFTDGGNLILAGNFVTTANDTITLFSDGTDFFEISRSAN